MTLHFLLTFFATFFAATFFAAGFGVALRTRFLAGVDGVGVIAAGVLGRK
jgi:hypothetical protein